MPSPLSLRDALFHLVPIRGLLRDLREFRAHPRALLGGVIGALSSLVWLAFVFHRPPGPPPPRRSVEFLPGSLIHVAPPATKPPRPKAKASVPESAPDDSSEPSPNEARVIESPAVSKSDEPAHPRRRTRTSRRRRPSGSDDSQVRRELPDLPRVTATPVDDPFATGAAWDRRLGQRDPWAAQVVAALSGLEVPSFAARSLSSGFAFRIDVCADGRIARVETVRGSGRPEIDRALVAQLRRVHLPTPPAELSQRMNDCPRLRKTFVWRMQP